MLEPRRSGWSADVYRPRGSVAFEWDIFPADCDWSPLDNPALDLLVSNPKVHAIYIGGLAPEYRVQAVCRSLLRQGITTIAVGNAIAAIGRGTNETKVWEDLIASGLIKTQELAPVSNET